MKRYDRFIFESYALDETAKRITLNYSLDGEISFTETIVLPANMPLAIKDRAALDRALFALHLIGGMSYYKTCLPPTIEIVSGTLTKEQADFWNTTYMHGFGEFFFKNDVDFRGLVNFPAAATEAPKVAAKDDRPRKTLTPVGGGKDSIVAIEMLKKAGISQTLLRVGAHPLIDDVARVAGLPLLTVGRNLSPALFDLNADGALNGHVPITAYLSCLSIVLAEAYGFDSVVFSDERSADVGNVEMHGMTVNHQWSKSAAFEGMFRSYLANFVTKNVEWFSVLRPFSELDIVRRFVEFPAYFEHFSSCNANWRIVKERPHDRWCGACPKCAFAFAMLAAFADKATVLRIFNGNDLFEDEALLPLWRELLGIAGVKPFECVGTPEETYAAFMLADDRGEWNDSAAMKMFEKEGNDLFENSERIVNDVLTPSSEHFTPEAFRSALELS